jgi:hypothetical protein
MFSTIPNIISRAFPLNPDARAFIIAAGITDATTIFAINELVNSLQVNSLWTKMAAIYPFAGDAAYRLTFFGGWTHSSNGALGNGTNSYADTFYSTSSVTQNDTSLGFYARVNYTPPAGGAIDMGSFNEGTGFGIFLAAEVVTNVPRLRMYQSAVDSTGTNQQGFWIGAAGSDTRLIKDGAVLTTAANSGTFPLTARNISLGAMYSTANASYLYYTAQQYAFAFIGSNLTNAEALTLTSLVQRYLNTLSRSIVAIPTVLDIDAQNFLVAAAITDNTQANAIQNLVAGLKSNSLWTKMQAAYPFVGGTSTTHKFNLKSPFDTNAAFRLTFSGGYTQNSNGIIPNGTNAFANTFYSMNTSGSLNDSHISVYSRTNVQKTGGKDIAALSTSPTAQTYLELRDTANQSEVAINDGGSLASPGFTDSSGLFVGSRPDASSTFLYRNTTQLSFVKASTGKTTVNLYLSALNNNGTAQQFSPRNLAWASIGSSLSVTDVSNLYTVVQAYQTALSRQV